MNKKLYAGISQIVLGILIAIAPQTFAHVCAVKETPMACHYTAQAALGIGIVIVALGIVGLFVSDQTRAGLDLANAVLGVLTIAVPTVLIGVCKGAMMRCHMVTLPTLIVLGVLLGSIPIAFPGIPQPVKLGLAGEARLTQYDATHHPWRVAPGQSQTQTVSYRGAHHRRRHAYRGLLWWFTAVHEP